MEEFKGEFDREGGFVSAHEAQRTDGSWFLKFSAGGQTPLVPDPRRTLPRPKRGGPKPRPLGQSPRQRLWSYTSQSLFDSGTHRMLVGWAVRWMHGVGHIPEEVTLPLRIQESDWDLHL